MNDDVVIGGRVIVQFGAKKTLSCIVAAVHENARRPIPGQVHPRIHRRCARRDPAPAEAISLDGRLLHVHPGRGDKRGPALGAEAQLRVAHSAAPGLYRARRTSTLSPQQEEQIVDALGSTEEGKALTFTEVGDLLGISIFHKVIKSLMQKDVIFLFEHTGR